MIPLLFGKVNLHLKILQLIGLKKSIMIIIKLENYLDKCMGIKKLIYMM
jgi:hypothetical protein